jgi:hypothetical protein
LSDPGSRELALAHDARAGQIARRVFGRDAVSTSRLSLPSRERRRPQTVIHRTLPHRMRGD